MRFGSKLFVVVALLLHGAWVLAQDDFHARVVAVYGFEQGSLQDEQITAKSSEMDEFWKLVKGDKSTYLPLLRRELNEAGNPSFFFYDGSSLLNAISQSREDQELALRCISHVSMAGIVRSDYLSRIQRFASQGLDTREAAFNILRDPDFEADFPAHALKLGQDFSLIYMLFPMQEKRFVRDLAGQLSVQHDPKAIKSVLLALWYTVTPEGTAAIEAHAKDATASPDTVAYARELLDRNAQVRKQARHGFVSPSQESLRKQRQEAMKRPISDEALEEFDQLTVKVLMAQ